MIRGRATRLKGLLLSFIACNWLNQPPQVGLSLLPRTLENFFWIFYFFLSSLSLFSLHGVPVGVPVCLLGVVET